MVCTYSAIAGSLNEFLEKNPEIKNNTEARMIVKDQVYWLALDEASHEGRENLGSRRDQLIRENGSEYARIAVKNFKLYCSGKASSYLSTKPDKETCVFFNSYQGKDISKEERLLKEAVEVIKLSFSKACILIGNGDDDGAIREINEAVYPGGEKNPYPLDVKTFKGIKDFYMQYRILDKRNCDAYTLELLKQSATN